MMTTIDGQNPTRPSREARCTAPQWTEPATAYFVQNTAGGRWFYTATHARAYILLCQAAELRDMCERGRAEILVQAVDELTTWFAGAVVGDTYHPGWGVDFVAALRLPADAGDWMEVADYEHASQTSAAGPPECTR